ncbi:hypothetical protein ACFWHT_05235 [Microbacterium sp. NPDC058342]|uniref:hypothetical protein n=1 Tax=Microbacterium sp. NPDC058342 TaxID=3346454 RepID=UPI00366A1BA6
MARPRILCLSLSPIAQDARVLRQISVLAEFGDVTTVGYGPKPDGVAHHIEVPSGLASLPQTVPGVLKLALRRLKAAELDAPGIVFARRQLKGTSWDLVVANEARILALAHAVADGAPVWADMHEWAPEERTHLLSWRLLVAPLMDHLCRVYLPKSAAITTVGGEIARLYHERYGVKAELMRNAPPFADLKPTAVGDGILRAVHSGAAVPGRDIESMIDAVAALPDRFTLDLYLVGGSEGARAYAEELKRRAAGHPHIRFRDPVRPHELPSTLNAYDVGIFWIPPVHTNARLTLPNKLFDFVQARLAVAVGPSIEMERIVEKHDLGVVSEEFSVDSYQRSLRSLTPESVRRFKENSDQAARDLSFEVDAAVARGILRRLLTPAI